VLVASIFSVVSFVIAVSLIRTRWRFTDTPTSDAAHVFPGLTEVHGVVEAIDGVANAPTDGADCVWWMYEVERYQRRSKNNSQWVTEELGVSCHPFHVRDASGVVRVVPDQDLRVSGAETRDVEHMSLTFLRPYAQVMQQTYEGVGFLGLGAQDVGEPISRFGGKWRAEERRLKVGDTVFITAVANLTPEGDRVYLGRKGEDDRRSTFEVSVGDEKAAIGHHASPWAIGIASLVSVGAAMFAADEGDLGPWPPLAVLGAGLVLYMVGLYNRVRRSRERCDFAWSLIDVACEQLSTTIPQLQTVVGAAMAHERAVQELAASARSLGRRPSAEAVATMQTAQRAGREVIALIESLPTMTTQPNVAQLMEQLTLLTDRVAFGRRFYNDSVQRLADRVGQFPDRLFAAVAGVKARPLIDDLGAPDTPPTVDLGGA